MPPPAALRASTSSVNGGGEDRVRGDGVKEVILFADTFNRYFERENSSTLQLRS